MKHLFIPRALFDRESVGGNGGEQKPEMPSAPSQEYLNFFLKKSQQAQEQQKINNLKESGEKSVVALNTILGMGQGGIDRFLTDGKIYKTIADGWMSDQVTPELAQKFKEQIILPVYGRQGWQIKANDVSVGFDPQNIINGYPAIRVNAKGTNSPLMMGIKNGVSSVAIPLPTTFGFNTIPALLPQIQQIPQSNLSFFNLPPEQNSGSGIGNSLKDLWANGGRELVRRDSIIANMPTIAQLWNTPQLSNQQRELFKNVLQTALMSSQSGFNQVIDIKVNQLGGFDLIVSKTQPSADDNVRHQMLVNAINGSPKNSPLQQKAIQDLQMFEYVVNSSINQQKLIPNINSQNIGRLTTKNLF